MKRFAAALVAISFVASPVLAQQENEVAAKTATNTHVRTTTRHIHATNVPVHHATHHRARHHAMHCGCPPTHMTMHKGKAHHMMHKTTTTTKTQS